MNPISTLWFSAQLIRSPSWPPLIYPFSRNVDLEKALEYGKKYMEQYAKATDIEAWLVE